MKTYQDMLRYILRYGEERKDRTGTGTTGVFGYLARYSLTDGFPLLTTKKMNFDKVLGETLWMLSGSTNAEECAKKFDFNIWRKWADDNGELGPIYGRQWRAWDNTHDQIKAVIRDLQDSPYSRRHVVSAWNPGDMDRMALPPCHVLFQFYVKNDGRLSCHLYQRSADAFLGVPYNIAGYSIITHIVAHLTGYRPGELVHSFGDLHIYNNHRHQVGEILRRRPRRKPILRLDPAVQDMESFYDDRWRERFRLEGYDPRGALPASVSI